VGPPVSRSQRGTKVVRGEAFPREGGGKRPGHHRRAASWVERVGWVGQEVEAQWGEGERAGWEGKGSGPRLGQKLELGPIVVIKSFRIFIWNSNFWQLWKFVQGDLEGMDT
jgi:hypothetical protein